MFQLQEIRRILPLILFWVGYTVLFLLWTATFFYTLPFLLGFLLAVTIQPAIAFLDRKLHWGHGVSTGMAVAAAVLLLLSALTFLGVLAVKEIAALVFRASRDGFSEFSQPVAELLNRLSGYFRRFDPGFPEQDRQEIMDLLQNSMDLVIGFLRTVLSVATSLPTVAAMLTVTVFSAYFFSRDMDRLRGWAKRLLSRSAVFHVKSAAETSGGMGRRYLLSYLFLCFLTFCEAFITLTILGLPYPLTTAAITAAADVLPVLGPGLVFLPLAFYRLLTGEYSTALGLLIGWAVISLIRQIVEPRLISATVKAHPLSILAAIYFSLVGKSLWILFYAAGFFTLHSLFRQTGALPSLTAAEENGDK